MGGDFHALDASVMGVDVVALDHAIEGFAIDGEDAGCGLLVSTRVFKDAGDVTTFDFRKFDPLFDRRLSSWRDLRLGRVCGWNGTVAHTLW